MPDNNFNTNTQQFIQGGSGNGGAVPALGSNPAVAPYLPTTTDLETLKNAGKGGAPAQDGGVLGAINGLLRKVGGVDLSGNTGDPNQPINGQPAPGPNAGGKWENGVYKLPNGRGSYYRPTQGGVGYHNEDVLPPEASATPPGSPPEAAAEAPAQTAAAAAAKTGGMPSDRSLSGSATAPNTDSWQKMIAELQGRAKNDMEWNPSPLDWLANAFGVAGRTVTGGSNPTVLEGKLQRNQERGLAHFTQDANIVGNALKFKYDQGMANLNAQLQAGTIIPAQYEAQSKLLGQTYYQNINQFADTIKTLAGKQGVGETQMNAILQSMLPGGVGMMNPATMFSNPVVTPGVSGAQGVQPLQGNVGR